jgi:hypothetical protein
MSNVILLNSSGTSHDSFSIGKRGITVFQSFTNATIDTPSIGDLHVNKLDGRCEVYTTDGWIELEKKKLIQQVDTDYYEACHTSGYIGCSFIGTTTILLPFGHSGVEITVKDQTGLCTPKNPIIITTRLNDLIDGETMYLLSSPYSKATFMFNNGWNTI